MTAMATMVGIEMRKNTFLLFAKGADGAIDGNKLFRAHIHAAISGCHVLFGNIN